MNEAGDMADVLSAAAHDLRSRLWVITSALDTYAHGDAAAARAEARWVGHVARTTERLLNLANALGVLSRIERGDLELDRQSVSLRGIVAQALELAKVETEGVIGPAFVASIPEELTVRGDVEYLPYAISHVLMRAARMSRERVVLAAFRVEEGVRLAVSPDKPASPDNARKVNAEWLLSERLIHAHGGVLEVVPAEGEELVSLCFRITLPERATW